MLYNVNGDNMTVEVLVELKAKKVDKTFTYLVPKDLEDKIKIGIRVLVPFKYQKLEGFVLKIENDKIYDYELKEIISIVDFDSVLNSEMLELGKYISKKTMSTLISCYQSMLPSALKAHKGFNVNKKYVTYLKLNEIQEFSKLNETQNKIIDLIKDKGEIEKSVANNISVSSVNTLLKKNIIVSFDKEIYRINNSYEKKKCSIVLNEEQSNVVNNVISNLNTFKPYLLFGVTGSGKTEVYMHIIEKVISLNLEAIVLVPEISLTPQIVNNFKSRFGRDIAILHSRLSDGEKYDEWRKIEKKEVKIAIGARSAIFAPFTSLGIIIIDEEHSQNYKQENIPKYSAIDVAIFRAKKHNCPLILGSATPSIESYTRAITGVYELMTLKNRVNNKTLDIKLIDMKNEFKTGNNILSKILSDKINERLSKDEQVIILLNRRGYSTVLTCHNCGYTEKCPNCDIPLTYHKTSNTMRCHYCGYGNKKLTICPNCHSEDINSFGLGTQKLEEYLLENFSNARVVRMDVDTTTKKGSHERIIEDFKKHKYNILVGTQMISKGLDFPLVTLVGVLNGDASLNIPDFRSGERTFQLLNQIAGRAGRGELSGEVIIQGFNLDHYSIKTACNNDYLSFYNEEMKLRKKLKYPPYYNICLIKMSGKDSDVLNLEANKVKRYLDTNLSNNVEIFGPNFSSIPKINNIFYMQIMIKYKKTSEILKSLEYLNQKYLNNKINLEVDLNPIKI